MDAGQELKSYWIASATATCRRGQQTYLPLVLQCPAVYRAMTQLTADFIVVVSYAIVVRTDHGLLGILKYNCLGHGGTWEG